MTLELIHYGQETARPPLVAVPGLDGSPASVEPIVEALSRKRAVAVVDYTHERNTAMEDLSAQIAGLVTEEYDRPVDLLGQSLGSLLAAQAVGRHPDMPVHRTVLTGTFLRTRRLTGLAAATLPVTPAPLYRATNAPLMALVCGPVHDGRTHPFFAGLEDTDKEVLARRIAWQAGRDFTEDLRAVPTPMLVLLGVKDRFVPHARRHLLEVRGALADRDASVVPLHDTGHVFLPSAAVASAVVAIEDFLDPPAPPAEAALPTSPAREALLDGIGTAVTQGQVRAGSVRTAFVRAGEGDPVVLLHGAAAGGVTWGPLLSRMADRSDVIAPDIVGYGSSDKPAVGYTREYLSRWLGDFLDALGLERVALVGNSQGGAAALQFAHDHPDRVRPLVLMCTEGLTSRFPPMALLGFLRLNTFPSVAAVRQLAPYLVHDPDSIDEQWADYAVDVAASPGGKRVFWCGRGRPVAVIDDEQLRATRTPTLLVWGEQNRFVPLKHAERARDVLPDAELVVIPDSGHLPFLEQPEAADDAVTPFLLRHGSRGST